MAEAKPIDTELNRRADQQIAIERWIKRAIDAEQEAFLLRSRVAELKVILCDVQDLVTIKDKRLRDRVDAAIGVPEFLLGKKQLDEKVFGKRFSVFNPWSWF